MKNMFTERISTEDFHFADNLSNYACRNTCFKKLEKAVKCNDELQSVLADLKASYAREDMQVRSWCVYVAS